MLNPYIESLKCLKDSDNSNELISFINSISIIKNFYAERVNKFSKYLCGHRELIEKFVDDLSSQTELYKSEEERNIIKDIELNRLHLFYMLSCIENGQRLTETNDNLYIKIALDFCSEYKENNSKLIDYIINFCVVPAISIQQEQKEISYKDIPLPNELSDVTDQQKKVYITYFKNPNQKPKDVGQELKVSASRVNDIIVDLCIELGLENNLTAFREYINLRKNQMCKICA